MEDEMYTYTQEMKDDFARRQDSKTDEMRARVKTLRATREAEERLVVEKKLDQAFQ